MDRPPVSLIVPFLGSDVQARETMARFGALRRHEGDEVLLVDNGAVHAARVDVPGVRVIAAPRIASSYFARNEGARHSRGAWLVFCDADTEPVEGLLEAYFDPPPAPRTAVLAGAVRDHPAGAGLAARLSRETRAMTQRNTLQNAYLPYAVTANCAVRRSAFEGVGGFDGSIRSGGDADLCWRLHAAGWGIEERPAALVLHRNRRTMFELWAQRWRHGSGAAWLARRHPGAMPRWGPISLSRASAAGGVRAIRALARGHRDQAAREAAMLSGWWAFELGRLSSNRATIRR